MKPTRTNIKKDAGEFAAAKLRAEKAIKEQIDDYEYRAAKHDIGTGR